jgi:hypothetical protein
LFPATPVVIARAKPEATYVNKISSIPILEKLFLNLNLFVNTPKSQGHEKSFILCRSSRSSQYETVLFGIN